MDTLKQITNPYLPSWEYVPDGEPYVFNDRVYIYGSHDSFGGDVYCPGDYVCWSAPVSDLGNWKYEGVIFAKGDDPHNTDLQGNLYAPDVTIGPDGRYYLFYVLSNWDRVSVAVCDEPAGKYQFYGYVHYKDGTMLGVEHGDEAQFDPAVLTEGDVTYLYTGFCGVGDPNKSGAMCTVLEKDMLTVAEGPVFVAPSSVKSAGTGFEGHAFFEGPSIRKRGNLYYFIYSSEKFRELCYAVSDKPTGGFKYQGVLVDNTDTGIDTYKPADMPAYYGANNHGSMVEIEGEWYIFYHRHTNGTNYSRQGCFEKLVCDGDVRFKQSEITSCAGTPFKEKGEYPAYIACNLFTETPVTYLPWSGWMDDRFPKITQYGGDGQEVIGHIANMRPGATAGFKYFACKDVKKIGISTKGYAVGNMEIRINRPDGKAIASIPIGYNNVWCYEEAEVNIPDEVFSLYFTYTGDDGYLQFKSFTLK